MNENTIYLHNKPSCVQKQCEKCTVQVINLQRLVFVNRFLTCLLVFDVSTFKI